MKELSVTEQLIYTTTRVECTKRDGTSHMATAFFCQLYISEESYIEVLVSNKHVYENVWRITFHICTLNDKDELDSYINYNYDIHPTVPIILHPDKNVDLAIIPLKPLLEDIVRQSGKKVFYRSIDSKRFADFTTDKYDAVEEVIMVGYPSGIWDDKNNRPIVRRGITATDPKVNYKGLPEFMIDCACIEGSSGSPVFSVKKGLIIDKFGNVNGQQGQIVELMGIQHAIPIKSMYANLEVIQKTSLVPATKIMLPINLGYIIKAEKLLDFIPLLKQ